MRLRQKGPGYYRGLFYGRFARIIPYIYRADVYRRGNELVSRKRLGPRRVYTMRLFIGNGMLTGVWSTGDGHGTIRLQRWR